MSVINTVVFDLGGVLIDWNPDYVYRTIFEKEEDMRWFYQHICKPVFENLKIGSLLYALCMIAFYWLIVYWLDRKKIYIKV